MRALLIATTLALAFADPGLAAPAKKPVVTAKKLARPAAKPAPRPVAIVPLPDTAETTRLRSAYAFALPVYEMMHARYQHLSKVAALGEDGINKLYARTALADATSRDVTTPNNDTLYATAWLDLAGGPVVLDAPAIPDRYHSAQLIDLYTDTVAVVGTSTGGRGGRTMFVGPEWKGKTPRDTTLVRSTTNDAWLLIRVVVNGPRDLDAATGLIRSYTLEAPAGEPLVPITAPATANPVGATFLAVVNEAIGRSPLPKRGAEFTDLGIMPLTPANAGDAPALPTGLWSRSLPALRAELAGGIAATGTEVDGWSYPGPGIGKFGDDDAGRARVALGGLAALPPAEAIYLTARTDKTGAPLSGSKAYTVRIPTKLPVGAFWSLTLYRQEADGRLFFVDTPSRRYAVGDRTPELRSERDGSTDIFVQAARPTGERVVNWLPAPSGPFTLIFRAYRPKPAFLDGSFRLPPIEPSQIIE